MARGAPSRPRPRARPPCRGRAPTCWRLWSVYSARDQAGTTACRRGATCVRVHVRLCTHTQECGVVPLQPRRRPRPPNHVCTHASATRQRARADAMAPWPTAPGPQWSARDCDEFDGLGVRVHGRGRVRAAWALVCVKAFDICVREQAHARARSSEVAVRPSSGACGARPRERPREPPPRSSRDSSTRVLPLACVHAGRRHPVRACECATSTVLHTLRWW